jgi:hypothetical protein
MSEKKMRRIFLRCRKLYNFSERLRMMYRKVSQYLSINTNLFLVKPGNESRIRCVVDPCGRIDAGNPEGAEFTFLRPTVTVCVGSGLIDVVFRNSVNLASRTPKTFRLRKEFLPAPVGCNFIL